MTLSEKIAYCRRRAGLSQEALAEQIDVSRQAVSKWETGEAQPEIGKLRALSATFGVSIDWLLSDEEPIEPQPQPQGRSVPSWVENLPGVLGRLVKRFGWLVGVYIAVGGLVFLLLGTAGILAVHSMEQAASEMVPDTLYFSDFQDPWGGGSTVQWYDEAGNPIDDPFGTQATTGVASHSPVFYVGGAILLIGLFLTLGGIVLAILLHRWGKRTDS